MDCGHVFEGHAGRIFSIALCSLPDGRRIAASASHDRSVKIWSINDLSLLRTIEYSDFVWRVFIVNANFQKPVVVAFIPTEDKIHVSDLDSGETINIFSGRLIFAGVVPIFNPAMIITAVGEEDLCLLDVNNGNPLRTIRGGFEKAFRAVVAPGANPMIAFTTWNAQNRRSTIQTYELSSEMDAVEVDCEREKMSLLFEGDSRDGVTSLVVTVGVKPMICSGHYDFLIRLWCIETKQIIMTLDGHSDYVGSVATWRGSQPIIVSGSSDGTIKAWNTQTGALIATGEGHARDVWAVAVTHGQQPLIVSGSFDRTVRLWDLNPMVANLNWDRRKDFCMFVSFYFGDEATFTSSKENYLFAKVFQIKSLCYHIAGYL